MNQIKFTKKHKKKFLEMAKALFPEHNIEMYYDTDIANSWEEAIDDKPLTSGNDAQVQFIIFNWHKPTAKMFHWFEFCITHLQNRLYHELSKASKLGIDTWNHKLIGRVYFHVHTGDGTNGHPIDYLYEEFLKLKL